MHEPPVNHRVVLDLFHLLHRVDPSATVNGTSETVRIAGLVFTLSLSPTARRDEYDGFVLRTINPLVGVLDTVTFALREHGVTTGVSNDRQRLEIIAPHTVGRLTSGVTAPLLRKALRNHLAAFTGRDLTLP